MRNKSYKNILQRIAIQPQTVEPVQQAAPQLPQAQTTKADPLGLAGSLGLTAAGLHDSVEFKQYIKEKTGKVAEDVDSKTVLSLFTQFLQDTTTPKTVN